MHSPLTDREDVEAVAAAIRKAGSFALDLEFVPEGRYVPELALVQVSYGDTSTPEAVAIDPLAVDPRPVLELVGAPDIETILHSGQADLALLGGAFQIDGANILDTQIAAAFLGLGDQIGYSPLVERVHEIKLNKHSQYTEWLQRPLSDQQLEYALDDVRYLPALWSELRQRLEAKGRLEWVEEECARLTLTADRRPPPAEAYRRIKGWGGLGRKSLGALRGIAAWREREARRVNRPPAHVIGDRSMQQLARSLPADEQQLAAVRGFGDGLTRRYGSAVLDALRAGADDPPPREPRSGPPDPRADVWATVLLGLVRARALDAEIAPRFIAVRADIDALTTWRLSEDGAEPPDLPLLRGWRRELFGNAALDWLRGNAVLRADAESPSGLSVGPPQPQ